MGYRTTDSADPYRIRHNSVDPGRLQQLQQAAQQAKQAAAVQPLLQHRQVAPSNSSPVTLTFDDSGWVVIKTPYNAAFVNDLKTGVPGSQRRWHGEAKVWKVHPDFLDQVRLLLETYYPDAYMSGDERLVSIKLWPVASPAFRLLNILPTASKQLIEAAVDIAMSNAVSVAEKQAIKMAYVAIMKGMEGEESEWA